MMRNRRSLRIAFVAPSFGEAEGQGRVNLEVVRRMLGHGVQIDVYTSRVPRGGIAGARVRCAPRPFPAELPNQILFMLWATLNVSVRRYDVVHADGASLLRRADIVAAHMLHSVWRRSAAGAAREPGLRGRYHALSATMNQTLERRAYRRAGLVVANSARTAADLVDVIGVRRDRIRVMPLGVDSERFRLPTSQERTDARVRLGVEPDEFVAVLVGAAEPRKGVPQAIDAFAGMTGARLIIVGDPRGDRAIRQARRTGASVQFVPWPADPLPYYWAADALLHPAVYEPFGLSVLEGMACGLPAVVTRTAGVLAVCNGSAIAIDAEAASIRKAIEDLRGDAARREAMARSGRAVAVSQTWDAAAEALIDAYREVSA